MSLCKEAMEAMSEFGRRVLQLVQRSWGGNELIRAAGEQCGWGRGGWEGEGQT